MEIADSLDAIDEARRCIRIRLVHEAFIAIAIGSWFGCVNPHDHENLVLDFLLELGQTMGIVQNGFLIV